MFKTLNEYDHIETIGTTNKPSLIKFTANWCHVCGLVKPIMERLVNDFRDKINFFEVDLSDNNNLELADYYQVYNLPTFVLIENRQIKDVIVGQEEYSVFKSKLKELIS